jgi:hypothetical protein
MKTLYRFGLVAVLIALFLSCNEGTNTIFENIINDIPVNNNNQLGNTSNVLGMTKLGSNYYAVTGVLRSRSETGTIWDSATPVPGFYNSIATDQVNNLYIGSIQADSTVPLFQYNPTTKAWSPVTISGLQSIVKVKNFGGNVYASYKKTDNTFSICSVSGALGTEIISGLASSIDDFVYTGTYVFFVSGSAVYRWDSSPAILDITPAPHPYRGVTYDPNAGNVVMLSTKDGYILRSTNPLGTLWEAAYGQNTFTSGSATTAAWFSEFVNVTPTHFLVGSRNSGFWEIEVSAALSVTRFNGSSYSELYNGGVDSFYTDAGAGPRVFFCTSGSGLWDNTYSDVTSWGSTWTRE